MLDAVAIQIKMLQLLQMTDVFDGLYLIVPQLQFLESKGLLELI